MSAPEEMNVKPNRRRANHHLQRSNNRCPPVRKRCRDGGFELAMHGLATRKPPLKHSARSCNSKSSMPANCATNWRLLWNHMNFKRKTGCATAVDGTEHPIGDLAAVVRPYSTIFDMEFQKAEWRRLFLRIPMPWLPPLLYLCLLGRMRPYYYRLYWNSLVRCFKQFNIWNDPRRLFIQVSELYPFKCARFTFGYLARAIAYSRQFDTRVPRRSPSA